MKWANVSPSKRLISLSLSLCLSIHLTLSSFRVLCVRSINTSLPKCGHVCTCFCQRGVHVCECGSSLESQQQLSTFIINVNRLLCWFSNCACAPNKKNTHNTHNIRFDRVDGVAPHTVHVRIWRDTHRIKRRVKIRYSVVWPGHMNAVYVWMLFTCIVAWCVLLLYLRVRMH